LTARKYGGDVQKLLVAYRILAPVVGVLLAFLSVVVLPMKYLLADGSHLQRLGEDLSILWVLHGWCYMAYLVVAFLLARRARWSARFTVLMLIAGLVPLLMFWVESQVSRRMRAERPDVPDDLVSRA
jgi:integral membrane protein